MTGTKELQCYKTADNRLQKKNQWVLQSAGTERHLPTSVNTRKMTYFGHLIRKKDKGLEKEIVLRTTPSARAMAIPKTSWLGIIRIWTGLTMEELLRTV